MERHLLFVDDEENILSSLQRLVRREDFIVHTASSGLEALEILQTKPIGVIISDQMMPEMTGVEFLYEAQKIQPDSIRMVLSGYTELKTILESINRGAIWRLLTKPWDDDQPQIELGTGKILGMEALIRWNHPTRGLLFPGDFINMLEDTGLIIPVGQWVISTACRELSNWCKKGVEDISISVNAAPRQLGDSQFFELVSQCIVENGISPHLLHIEIIESTLMEDEKNVAQTMDKLCKLGVSFVMDDFGTGYSSLSYLRRFPITTLKIDKSFIADVPTDKDDCDLTRATISMCQIMNQQVVAEGVESKEQLDFLIQHGCDIVQVFYISKPMSATDTMNYISSHKNDVAFE